MQYYTDPISRRVFRTLKSVLSYLGTGEMSKHAYLPRRNVIDMYSFDKCVDLVITFLALYLSLPDYDYLSEILSIIKDTFCFLAVLFQMLAYCRDNCLLS
jgi:hypothetical protein